MVDVVNCRLSSFRLMAEREFSFFCFALISVGLVVTADFREVILGNCYLTGKVVAIVRLNNIGERA